MSILGLMKEVTIGAATGVALLTALPVLGTVGTLSAVGVTVGSILGGTAGAADYINKES